MNFILFLILNNIIFCCGIQIRVTYSEYAPNTVLNESLQEILNTVYLDGKAVDLVVPQYISRMEEIKYRENLNEKQIQSVFNFRNLVVFSMVNNTQKKIPNFRNLQKIKKIEIKECNIVNIDKNVIANVGVEELDFQKNQIISIENNAFGKKVNSVNLKCNLLTSISPGWFRNASNLRTLNLESNKIKILQEKLFKNFVQLNELYLAKNEIIALEPGSLSGPTNMLVLDLSVNDILIINADVFSEKEQVYIANIKISFNKLSFFNEDFMKKVIIYEKAIIYGNPWQCECVKEIRDWLPASGVQYTVEGEPSCVFTKEKSKECIKNVTLNDELYNYFISNYYIVDTRECSIEKLIENSPAVEERLSFYSSDWFHHDIDLRSNFKTK